MRYLLDTDALIEIEKNNGDLLEKIARHTRTQFVTSAICAFEFDKGFYAYRGEASPFKVLHKRLRVLPITQPVAAETARILSRPNIERSEVKNLEMDALIAATAAVHSLTVITRNTADFNKLYKSIAVNWC